MRRNFLVWRHVKAAGMMGYLDDNVEEPPAVLLSEKEVVKKETAEAANPAHVAWATQDQQVLTLPAPIALP